MSSDCTSPPSSEVVRDRNKFDLASDGMKFHFGGKFNFNEVDNTVEFVGGNTFSWGLRRKEMSMKELYKIIYLFVKGEVVGDGGIKDKDNYVGDDVEFDVMMKMLTSLIKTFIMCLSIQTQIKQKASDQTVGGESDHNCSIETNYMEDPNCNWSMVDEEDVVSQKNVGASGNGFFGGNNADGGDVDECGSEEMHSEHIRQESNKIYYDPDNPKLRLKMIFTDRKQFKEVVIDD
ncbi:hypothetical protein ACFE04_012952 [Oxalis oulophora]